MTIPEEIYFYACTNSLFKSVKYLFKSKEELLVFIDNILKNLPWKDEESKHYFEVLIGSRSRKEILKGMQTYQTINTNICTAWKKLFPCKFYNPEEGKEDEEAKDERQAGRKLRRKKG